MWFNIKYLKIPSHVTKYFDKLVKIKFYILWYPSHVNMKNNAILRHVDFLWNSLDNILISISLFNIKKKNHLNKPLNKSLNFECLTHIPSINFLFNFMVSKTLVIVFPFFGIFFKNEKNSPNNFFGEDVKIHIK